MRDWRLSADHEVEQRQFPPIEYPKRDETHQGERSGSDYL